MEEAAKGGQREVRVIPLVNALNTQVAPAVADLFAQIRRPDVPSDVVSVIALANTRAVVVAAAKEKMPEVEHLIQQLDTAEVSPQLEFRIYPLENVQPTKVLPALQQMLQQVQRQWPGEPINIQADERIRSIIVTARGPIFGEIEKIIKALDRAPAFGEANVLVVQLKRADAVRLASVLNEMLRPSATDQVTPEARALQEQVRQLKIQSTQDPDTFVELNLTKPIKITSDPNQGGPQGSNALLITSTADNLKALAAVVEMMDRVPITQGAKVRIVHLKNADAQSVVTVLNDIFTQGKKLAGAAGSSVAGRAEPETVSGKALVNVLNASADPRTNAVVLSGTEESLALADLVVQDLDRSVGKVVTDVRLFRLKNADAQRLAPLLQSVFTEGAAQPGTEGLQTMVTRLRTALKTGDVETEFPKVRAALVIQADPTTNILVVAARSDVMPLIAEVIATMDIPGSESLGPVQVYPLKKGNAGSLSQTLINFFNLRYQAARTPELQRQKPVIVAEVRTNSLLVGANDEDTKILESLLAKLDVELVDPAVQLVVIPLQHNASGIVGPAIKRIFDARLLSMTPAGTQAAPQDRVDVETDALSNAMIISASKENLGLVRGLLEKVDVEPASETGIVRLYALQNADAQRVATMLDSLISKGLYKPGLLAAGSNTLLQAREKVSIAVDIRTNVLIISASQENFSVIEEILKRVDSTEAFGLIGTIRLYALKHADATRLGPTLQNLFNAKRTAEQAAGGSGLSLAVSIIPDPRTNTLLVAGSRESFAALDQMIQSLDASDVTVASEFRVFQLKQATATAIQPVLTQLFSQRVSRDTAKNPMTVLAEPRTNALIVGASPEDMPLAEALIAQLDRAPEQPGETVQVFALKKADATQVATTLRNLLQAEGATGVGISVNERVNALVVSAGAADLKRISDLVARLDTDALARVTEIRIFTLANADATELAQILTDALTRPAPTAVPITAGRQAVLQFITRTKDGQELIASGLQEGVLVSAVRRSNSLIVLAPVENMPLLESLIHSLDMTNPRFAEIRVFQCQNADATQMATILANLFRLTAAANQAQAVQYTLVSGEKTESGASATLGTAEQYALTVTVDVRTNSLLVGGTRQYTDLVLNIVKELDSSPAQERMTEVYHLRNAQAADVQTTIRSFLDQERTRLTTALGTNGLGAAQRLLEQDVAIVAEATTNTLLISASPRYFDTIFGMIRELDAPPPQVLIEVLLAEVSLNDTIDLGLDWNLLGDFDNATKNYTVDSSFGAQALLGTTGFSVSVTGTDFGFFLRALQSQGRLEVLSRPSILTSDNKLGSITVGQRVPFITDSRVTDTGATINTIQYQDVAILLEVTPRINPDGTVRMDVHPEISSLSKSTVEIQQGVNAVIVDTRTAQTTLTVQDGHTIVMGGLITTEDNETQDKIPLLGDLPALGPLFRRTSKSKTRRELLIILTPTIIRNAQAGDATTTTRLDRLNRLRTMQDKKAREFNAADVLKSENDATEVRPIRSARLGAAELLQTDRADAPKKSPAEDAPK